LRGRAAVGLAEPFTAVLEQYTAALRSAPLSDQTRRTYASKVRQAGLQDDDVTAHVYADPVVMPMVPRRSVHVGILAALMSA
jgi:hypothetical protein